MTKFLISMEASGLPFTLVLNKADLVSTEELQARVEQVGRACPAVLEECLCWNWKSLKNVARIE